MTDISSSSATTSSSSSAASYDSITIHGELRHGPMDKAECKTKALAKDCEELAPLLQYNFAEVNADMVKELAHKTYKDNLVPRLMRYAGMGHYEFISTLRVQYLGSQTPTVVYVWFYYYGACQQDQAENARVYQDTQWTLPENHFVTVDALVEFISRTSYIA